MLHHNLLAAISEAERFLVQARQLEREAAALPMTAKTGWIPQDNPRLRGAVKRSSMDLTRSLSRLRQERPS